MYFNSFQFPQCITRPLSPVLPTALQKKIDWPSALMDATVSSVDNDSLQTHLLRMDGLKTFMHHGFFWMSPLSVPPLLWGENKNYPRGFYAYIRNLVYRAFNADNERNGTIQDLFRGMMGLDLRRFNPGFGREYCAFGSVILRQTERRAFRWYLIPSLVSCCISW